MFQITERVLLFRRCLALSVVRDFMISSVGFISENNIVRFGLLWYKDEGRDEREIKFDPNPVNVYFSRRVLSAVQFHVDPAVSSYIGIRKMILSSIDENSENMCDWRSFDAVHVEIKCQAGMEIQH